MRYARLARGGTMAQTKVDPLRVTDYDRSEAELQRFYLFTVFVAGKNADWAAGVVDSLLRRADEQGQTPFEYLRQNEHDLHNLLVVHRVGQYGRITRAIAQSLDLNLRTCTVEDLENVFGVGPKTARFFVLHTRSDAKCAVLDTHILRWLREVHGVTTPKSTPPRKEYARLERIALSLMAAEFPHLTPAQADLLIWSTQSGRLDDGMDEPPELPGVPS